MIAKIDVRTLSLIGHLARRKKNKRRIRSTRRSLEKKAWREVEAEIKRSKLDSLSQKKANQDHPLPTPGTGNLKKKEPEK